MCWTEWAVSLRNEPSVGARKRHSPSVWPGWLAREIGLSVWRLPALSCVLPTASHSSSDFSTCKCWSRNAPENKVFDISDMLLLLQYRAFDNPCCVIGQKVVTSLTRNAYNKPTFSMQLDILPPRLSHVHIQSTLLFLISIPLLNPRPHFLPWLGSMYIHSGHNPSNLQCTTKAS